MRSHIHIFAFLIQSLFWVTAQTAELCTHDHSFIPDAVLRVTAANLSQSCYPAKETILVNGTSPGPELRLTEGKTYWIRVYNDMLDANLTMHWHGLSMAVSPFADGTPSASQWAIPPAHFFDYEINVPHGMAGTYFYHSHVGFQAVSAAGPLIVDEVNPPPYQYDEEKIVFLQDMFKSTDKAIELGLVANPLNWSNETSMILINGKGGGTSNVTASDANCNSTLSLINVEPGKTYRLRFIASTALTFGVLAFEGHDSLMVVEADGSYTKPYNTSFLQLGSGQRYSVLLTTKSAPEKSSYYMQIESRDRPTITRSFAMLNYGPKPATKPPNPPTAPLTLPNTTRGFLDDLAPLYPSPDYPSSSQVTRRITLTVHQHVSGQTVWLQNGYNWTDSFVHEPYLVSLYKNDGLEFPSIARALSNNGIDPITRSFPAEIGEVLEIVIQNTGADKGGLDSHPFHAHGSHFWDLGSGNGTYNNTANDLRWDKRGYQPPKRDTSMLYRYASSTGNGTVIGWRAWRLRVTEPGVWMVHCHILEHMEMGMQSVWVFGNETELLGRVGYPEVNGYLSYGGDVYGNETHAPEMVHFKDDAGPDAWSEEQKVRM